MGQSVSMSGSLAPLLDQRKTDRFFVKHINIAGQYNKLWANEAQEYEKNALKLQKIELQLDNSKLKPKDQLRLENQGNDLSQKSEMLLNDLLLAKKKVDLKKNFGVAFIIFNNPDGVREFIQDFEKVKCKPVANVYEELSIWNWRLAQAPCPSDITWENLNRPTNISTLLISVWLYILMFLICSFLVTPNFVSVPPSMNMRFRSTLISNPLSTNNGLKRLACSTSPS